MTLKICLFATLFACTLASAQDRTYTLQDCIDIALTTNYDLKAATLRRETAAINLKQNKNALLPSVNGTYNLGSSRGRSIDPFTNDFVNDQLTFSNAGLGVNATIFNGFRLINGWKQAQLNLAASDIETLEARQQLVIDVTLSFLQVINARDLITLTQGRIAATNEQLTRLKSLYEEESGDPADYSDLQGQIANDELALIMATNDLNLNIISLNTLLNYDRKIQAQDLQLPIAPQESNLTIEQLLEDVFNNSPTLKSRTLRLEAASKAVAVARGAYMPEVSLFGNLGTNYSSAARLFTETGSSIQDTGSFVTVNNTNLPVFADQTTFTAQEISYGNQFSNNLNTFFGVAVSLPIFNSFEVKNNLALEKIRKQEAQVALDRSKLEVQEIITQSYNTMRAAYDRLKVLERQVAAYKESFRINEIRFNNGVTTSVAYIASKNNLDNAQINLTNVTYEYELRNRILMIYRNQL